MKKIKILAMFLVTTLLAVGCNQTTEKQEDEQQTEVINVDYIKLTMTKPETINPILNTNRSVAYAMTLVYDGLFKIDENYNVVPQLVEEYSIASNGKSIYIKLKDATWHDNTQVTSQDVQFTINTIKNNEQSPYNYMTSNISSVNILNEREFNINFKQNYAFSKETLVFPIISKDQLNGLNKDYLKLESNNEVGNGVYKIEKFEEREEMILVPNENYYNLESTMLKDIHIKIVPDQESRTEMILALESDITDVSLEELSKFQEERFDIINYQGREYEYILLNHENDFIKDINFRKALAHIVDKEKIVKEAYIGDAVQTNFPINTTSEYYNKELEPLEFSFEKAKESLSKVNVQNIENSNEEAKQTKDNKNEKTETTQQKLNRKLKELNLNIIVNKDNLERVKVATTISQNLNEIGIKATVSQLTAEELDNALQKKEYDLAILGWQLSSIPDINSIINSSGYVDEKLSNYINSLSNISSEEQTKQIYNNIQRYIVENVPFISIAIRDEYIVQNTRIQGDINPNSFNIYNGMEKLKIDN